MIILLTVSESRAWRWTLRLARRIEAAGHAVCVDVIRDGAAPLGGGFDTVCLLEGTLYRLPAEPRYQRLSCADFVPFASRGDRADLHLDLTEMDAPVAPEALFPTYDGSRRTEAVCAAILDGSPAHLAVRRSGAEPPVVAALPAIENGAVFCWALEMYLAAVETILFELVVHDAVPLQPVPASGPGVQAGMALADAGSHVVRSLAGKIAGRLARHLYRQDHWRAGIREDVADGEWDDPSSAAFTWLRDDFQRYYADPFPVTHEGRSVLFVEEYPYATGKGLISCAEIGPGGLGAARPVLEQDCHLSYPFIFSDEGRLWMIPETSARRTVELWECAAFPDRWEQRAILIDGLDLSDATLARHQGRYYLFASLRRDDGSCWDTLVVHSAEKLRGPWTQLSHGPALIDASSARPAGALFRRNGDLYRPAQDCVGGYGRGVSLCRIDELSPERFRQTKVARLAPPRGMSFTGMHTLNTAGGVEAIDACGPAWVAPFSTGGRKQWTAA